MHMHRRLRARLRTLALVGVVVVAALSAATTPTWAEITPGDIAFDSELTLLELNNYGSYHRYFIALTIQNDTATLSIDKDGETATVSVPLDECQAMWQRLLDSGLEALTDSPGEDFPDQSTFIVQFRVTGQEGGFWAYGVDSLSDPGYRNVVEEILAMGNSYLE